jgi:integrase
LKKHNLYDKKITEIKKQHIINFLNNLGKEKNKIISPVTRNSYRKNLSGIFQQMYIDEIIPSNFIETIPKLKEKPKKNTPFIKKEIEKIKNHLLEHDPYLYLFINFILYGFFRPVEVCRIKIKDINFDRNTINVASKTEDSIANTVLITKQLHEAIENLHLNNLDKNLFIFSKDLKPGIWSVDDYTKRTWFGNRFKKIKKILGFNETYGLYSFRHTAAINLFTNYKSKD